VTTLVDVFEEVANRHPDRIAIVEPGGRSVTYRALMDQSAKLATSRSDNFEAPSDPPGFFQNSFPMTFAPHN
jgi:acyl-CoA synthetase (AMP-forming)/AMP-acid ligase II